MAPFFYQGKERGSVKISGTSMDLTPEVKAAVYKNGTICIVRPTAEVSRLKDSPEAPDQVSVQGGTSEEMRYGKGVFFGRKQTPVRLSYQKDPNSPEQPIGTVIWENNV